MIDLEHVLVCYGDAGYHHGAKYQILRHISLHEQNSRFCVVTDKPHLFANYPCRVLTLTQELTTAWSLQGKNHFGIKLKGLFWATKSSSANKLLLLDTDMYWLKNPTLLSSQINEKTVVMYKNEGLINNSKNISINKFEEGLTGKTIKASNRNYTLTTNSRMWGSAIIGLTSNNAYLLDQAFELFTALDPFVAAHTIEQFALSETLRVNRLSIIEGRNYVRDWSSIGRKNYATPELNNFFRKYGESNFTKHLAKWREIKIKRPFLVLISQKISKMIK